MLLCVKIIKFLLAKKKDRFMAENKKKILFCLSPYLSLIKKHACNELQIGPALVKGTIDERMFDTTFIDLDVFVSTQRSVEPVLSSHDFCLLQNTALLEGFSEMVSLYETKIDNLIDRILSFIPPEEYDYLVFSVPRRSTTIVPILISINFTFLLSKRLKDKTGGIVIMGGSGFRNMSLPYVKDHIAKYLSSKYIDFLFLNDGALTQFPRLLHELYSGSLRPKAIADVTFIGNKAFYKPTSFKVRLWAVIGKICQYKCTERVLKKILLSRKKKIIGEVNSNIEPDFSLLNRQMFAVNAEEVFQLAKYFPEYNYKSTGELKENGIIIYPLQPTQYCPYSCYFCGYALRQFQLLSVKKAVDQIERLIAKHCDARYFRFFNCSINFSPQYAIAFADEIIRRKINIRFIDSVHLRHPSEEVFEALRKSGCVKVWVGLETLSPRLLNKIHKCLSVDDIYKGIELLHEQGLWIGGNIITGLPFENDSDHVTTLQFIKEMQGKINAWDLNVFRLYPNSPYQRFSRECNLRLRPVHSFTDTHFTFDEVGGLTNEENKPIVMQRYRKLLEIVPDENEILNNDYLVLHLYDIFGFSKHRIYTGIIDYAQKIKVDRNLVNLISVHRRGYDYELFIKKEGRGSANERSLSANNPYIYK